MTPSNGPYIFLRRLLVITHTGAIAYDQTFHDGVNIIRGQNSSGKSTIANFIFFILGGDFHNWTSEALRCREVYGEVEVSGAIITLKRLITAGGQQPMSIFWGPYETAKADNLNWQSFPYKQTALGTSFSNVLFKALKFPEVKTEGDSNITMHQVLRLLYIDQDSAPQHLFRFERFDLPLTRQAVTELLLGLYEDVLYQYRLDLKSAQKDLEEKKRDLEGISRIQKSSGGYTTVDGINSELLKTRKKLESTDEQIKEIRQKDTIKTTKKSALPIEKVQEQLFELKSEIRDKKNYINNLEVEIFDSKQFIETLRRRVLELENSSTTRKVFGELPVTFCPHCLSSLTESVEGSCFLCKQPLTADATETNIKRLRQGLEIQIKESLSLIEERQQELSETAGKLNILIEQTKGLQKQLDYIIAASQPTRDERLDNLLITKGGLERQVEFLSQQLNVVQTIELLKQGIIDLGAFVQQLKFSITEAEQKQALRMQQAMTAIKRLTLFLLKNDLARQDEFINGKILELDFQRDTFLLDGNNNFSASSKIYFKNCILFAIFFASLEVDFFRYPRFILCDNMEDKGMEKERTQNFQKVITDLSESIDKRHQIIFTTSMINPELNIDKYAIGPEYSISNKSLKL